MRYVIFVLSFIFLACNVQVDEDHKSDTISEIKATDGDVGADGDAKYIADEKKVGAMSESGGNVKFKIPLSPKYNWEVAQSWAAHCQQCDKKYPYDEFKYCADSHVADCCKYGWDFNLEGNKDEQKPILASGKGKVKKISKNIDGWGNCVVIDHGDNVCTRYAHMYNEPIVKEGQSVCQGLKLGEIGSTGNSKGPHLHFQFENCETGIGLEMGFDDGNEIPVCTKGVDVFDGKGNYNALKLTNTEVSSCVGIPENFSGGELGGKKTVEGDRDLPPVATAER